MRALLSLPTLFLVALLQMVAMAAKTIPQDTSGIDVAPWSNGVNIVPRATGDDVLDNFLANNHLVVNDTFSGQEFHIFGYVGNNSLASPSAIASEWCFHLAIPIGPLTFRIDGCIDLANGTGSITICAQVPLLGCIQIAKLSGNLRGAGICANINIPGIFQGTLCTFIAPNPGKPGQWLWLKGGATILGKILTFNIPLLQLPI